ncbi:hypothetical protein JB92DRAFT_2837886 [Gautieria morchelliformis]|nr:hypothetical protein JB92DRAFT_2837886 [Gautieria morchelliformis]
MPSAVGTSRVTSKKSRGRPSKVRRGVKPRALSASTSSQTGSPVSEAATSTQAVPSDLPVSPSSIAGENEPAVAVGSKRTRDIPHEDETPAKRIRCESTDDPIPDTLQSKSSAKKVVLPARRSTRQTTVYATQASEGTLRPPGPPALEAALQIALGNLESETWRYLWSNYKKHQGQPLPTPSEIKAACPSVRRAAEAVDQADRELEQAVDQIMLANAKKTRRGGTTAPKIIDKDTTSTSTPTPDI